MATKSTRFRIGVEGATTDGRTIPREWLTQMAQHYDPNVFGARVNVEHFKSYSPKGEFGRFGDVISLHAEEINEGALAGKMALYAEIEPTHELIELNKKRQKMYTSMEIDPEFADFNWAYLVGLAVTDDPASLGTQRLHFTAGGPENPLSVRKFNPHNLFSVAEETRLEFEDIPDPIPSLIHRVAALFSKKEDTLGDVQHAVRLCAQETQQLERRVEKLDGMRDQLADLENKLVLQHKAMDTLIAKLEREDACSISRPRATGGEAAHTQTDC